MVGRNPNLCEIISEYKKVFVLIFLILKFWLLMKPKKRVLYETYIVLLLVGVFLKCNMIFFNDHLDGGNGKLGR